MKSLFFIYDNSSLEKILSRGKKMVKLSKRLKQIAEFVPLGTVVADIGTDHALLPSYVVQERLAPSAIAVDVREGPWDVAKKQVDSLQLSDKIAVRLGDGLKPIKPGEVETVVVAGMGGATIKQILTASPEVVAKLQRLILQPNLAGEMIREWALHNCWKIVDEEIIYEDDRFYEIIVLEPGQMEIKDEIYLYLGPKLVEKYHVHLVAYLTRLKANDQSILNELKKSNRPDAKSKLVALEAKWDKIGQVIKCQFNVEI